MFAFRTLVIVALIAAGSWAMSSGGSGASALHCNGSARLCDVPLGNAAFATSHNSMSSPADRFFGPNQGQPIVEQLKHGIRGFQIDAYAGTSRKGRVYTELAGPFGSQATDLPAALVATAKRIHQSLGAPPPGTPTQLYLCHTFCELGAIPFSTVARQIRTFLDSHKNEVLVSVIEDYVPPTRIHEVFQESGLNPRLLEVHAGQPLPTLGSMVQTGKRLFVSLENGEGGPTLPNAFAGLVEETPYTFLRPSDLENATSCRPNRGSTSGPIFQLNHWLTPPTRTTARRVNTGVLRARVKQCTDVRGRAPTLVAVDFAESSDVVSVVNDLNRNAAQADVPATRG